MATPPQVEGRAELFRVLVEGGRMEEVEFFVFVGSMEVFEVDAAGLCGHHEIPRLSQTPVVTRCVSNSDMRLAGW